MRTVRTTLPALIVSVLVVACSDQQPVAPAIEVTPDFGATVVNDVVFLHPVRFTWLDNDPAFDPPDVALLGYDPADDLSCNDGVFGQGIPAKRHVAISQQGFPWGQREQAVLTTIGRPPLYLYRVADFPAEPYPEDPWCAFLTEGWIAAGSWSATLTTDNDISGFDGTPGMNSFGGTETGVLWGSDSDQYKYSWKYRLLFEPERGVFKVAHSVDNVVQIK